MIAARAAADFALAHLAADEARRWYVRGLEWLASDAKPDEIMRAALCVGLGQAQEQTGEPGYRETLLDAAAPRRCTGRGRPRRAGRAGEQPRLREPDRRRRSRAHRSARAGDRRSVGRPRPCDAARDARRGSDVHRAGADGAGRARRGHSRTAHRRRCDAGTGCRPNRACNRVARHRERTRSVGTRCRGGRDPDT